MFEMSYLKKWVSRKTAGVRYSVVLKIVKVATPSLYKTVSMYDSAWVPRPMINFASVIFNGKPVVGAEIGVFEGRNAKSILQTLNVQKLYLIDPYVQYGTKSSDMQRQAPDALPFATKNLSRFKDRIEWVRKTSEDALRQFPDAFFDFVYVDGNHDYEYVKKDLEGYWKKVRAGGILGGHDFCGVYSGVVKAVMEFSKQVNKPLFGKRVDFWFIKDSVGKT